jgi:hypothetical protein
MHACFPQILTHKESQGLVHPIFNLPNSSDISDIGVLHGSSPPSRPQKVLDFTKS